MPSTNKSKHPKLPNLPKFPNLPKLPNKDKAFSNRGLPFAVGVAIVEERVCCVGWWSVVCCGALILLRKLGNLRRGSAVQ